MKRTLAIVCLLAATVFPVTACSQPSDPVMNTAEWARPENYYSANPSIDMFVYEKTVCENAEGIDWITDLTLTPGQELGTIKRTGVTTDFHDFDATKLPVGAIVYTVHERGDILLVRTGDLTLPYLKVVEG